MEIDANKCESFFGEDITLLRIEASLQGLDPQHVRVSVFVHVCACVCDVCVCVFARAFVLSVEWIHA